MEAELSCSNGTPGDTISGFVEAGEGDFESLVLLWWELVGDWDLDVVHDDHACGAGSQGELSLDLGSCEAGHAFFEDEASDVVGLVLGPDDEHVSDGGVGDPGFGAVEHEVVTNSLGGRFQGAWVGTGEGLGDTEATDQLSADEFRQESLLLLL